MREAVASKIEEIAQRVAESEGLELVEVEVKGGGNSRLVRISIDKPEGVTHADCELVSQQVGTILDVEDVVPGPLHARSQLSRSGTQAVQAEGLRAISGEEGEDHLREPVEGRRNWEGTLAGLCRTASSRSKPNRARPVEFPFEQVQKANLKFEW